MVYINKFSHFQGFVNSGYGVNGIAHVSFHKQFSQIQIHIIQSNLI